MNDPRVKAIMTQLDYEYTLAMFNEAKHDRETNGQFTRGREAMEALAADMLTCRAEYVIACRIAKICQTFDCFETHTHLSTTCVDH